MHIKKALASGFKQFRDAQSFTFYQPFTLVEGDNNTGKTTLAEMITYCVFGCDLSGSNKVDHLMNNGGLLMSVSTWWEIGGQEYHIYRERDNSGKSTKSTLLINERESTEIDVVNLFGKKEYFMASFWPEYILAIDDKDAAALIGSLVRDPAPAEIKAELAAAQIKIVEGLKVVAAEKEMADRRKEIRGIDDAIKRMEGQIKAYREQIAQEIPLEVTVPTSEDLDAVMAEIMKLRAAEQGKIDPTPIERDIKRLLGQIEAEKKNLVTTDALEAVCPTCGQELTLDALDKVYADVSAKNMVIVHRCNQMADEIREYTARVEEINRANAMAGEDVTAKIAELYSKHKGMRLDLENGTKHNARRRQIIEDMQAAQGKADELDKTIKQYTKDQSQLAEQITVLGECLAIRERLKLEQISKNLKRASINLFSVVKSTGEVKPDFKLTYDGQKHKTMSNSNRIRCGLEIHDLICNLTGRDYPVYVDNAEGITHFDEPTTQLLAAYVRPASEIGAELRISPF